MYWYTKRYAGNVLIKFLPNVRLLPNSRISISSKMLNSLLISWL